MYNQKILKYKYKLRTSNDLRKKNLYKSKLAHYNQLGGMELVKKPCTCREEYVAAAAGNEPPCTCVPTVRLDQPRDFEFQEEIGGVVNDRHLVSHMRAFTDEEILPTDINFDCSKDQNSCHLRRAFLEGFNEATKIKFKSVGIQIGDDLDHTECFREKYVKTYPYAYRVNKLVISSRINLSVLLNCSVFDNLIELEIESKSKVTEIPDNVGSKLQSLEKLTIFCCPIIKIPIFNNLKTLTVFSCKKIEKIPILPNLLQLDCSSNPLITQLPVGLLYLEKLNCSATGVTDIPLYPNLLKLVASNCRNLDRLGSYPLLKHLNITECRKIVELPLLMNLEELVCYNILDEIDLEHIPKIIIINTNKQDMQFIYRVGVPKPNIIWKKHDGFYFSRKE